MLTGLLTVFIVYAVFVVVFVILTLYLIHVYNRLRTGKYDVSVQDLARHTIAQDQFFQEHPAEKRVNDAYRPRIQVSSYIFLAAVILPMLWIVMFPGVGSPTAVLSLIAIFAIAVGLSQWRMFSTKRQLRQIYRQNNLLVATHIRVSQLGTAFQIYMVVFAYATLLVDAIYTIFWF